VSDWILGRENFTTMCLGFQADIDGRENCEVRTSLSEKDSLENEIQLMDKKHNVLKNSVLAFVEEVLEDLNSNMGDIIFLLSPSTYYVIVDIRVT